MNILDNELVKKYFSPELTELNWHDTLARNVLYAMQEVINKGDRCLMVGQDGSAVETTWKGEPLLGVRTNSMRLPDKFQEKELKQHYEIVCQTCGETIKHRCGESVQKRECECSEGAKHTKYPCGCCSSCHPLAEPQRKAVEEKIREIGHEIAILEHVNDTPGWADKLLRELVSIVEARS